MSAELIAILAVGVGLVSAGIALGGIMVALITQSERLSSQRMDRFEDGMNRQFEGLRAEMNRRFDEQDVRIRGLEQGQAYLSGQLSAFKDCFTHDATSGDTPENAG